MKVKVSGLEGMALSYTMCMIEMPHLVWGKSIGLHHASKQIVVPELPEPKCYSPFMDWDRAGTIIEEECITITAYGAASSAPRNPDHWEATLFGKDGTFTYYGHKPLIAAMRAFVASRLGTEVEIPSELP